LHAFPVAHAPAHRPQFAGSVFTLTQPMVPPQFIVPVGQPLQTPPEHVVPGTHLLPYVPQLFTSEEKLKHPTPTLGLDAVAVV
jgi:hypothetical protein